MTRNFLGAAPFILAVPLVFGLAFVAAGHAPAWLALGAGALGWLIALALRAPVALVTLRLRGASPERVQPVVVASSGPLEEGVRLVAVLLIGRELTTAFWLGLGWAAIEVLYSLVNGVAMAQLAKRDDPEAQQAKALMPPVALSENAPWWGVLERVFASALHIGFTLILAALPLAVLLTAPVHSAVNLGFLSAARRWPMAAVMATGLIVGFASLLIGFWLHG